MPVQLTLNVHVDLYVQSSLSFFSFSSLWVWCLAAITLYGMVPIHVESVYITLYGVYDVMIFGPLYKSCDVHCINF